MFSIEQLKRHAVTLAEQHLLGLRTGPDRLLPRLADNERVLQEAYDLVTRDAASGQRIVPAEAWLLDNFYLIEQQISLARRHLPRGFSTQLPCLVTGPLAGFPRIYQLALELTSHMDGRVDNDNVISFIAAYQNVEPLRLGELWAFPIMLQLALLENLRCVGLRIAQGREEYSAAVRWADRMLSTAETEPNQLIRLLAEFASADIPLTAPFVEEFYDRLRVQESALAFVQTWVEQQLRVQGVTPASLSEAAGRNAAANQISMANSIGSLRFIDAADWTEFVESQSAVEQILRGDPFSDMGQGEGYAAQDFATRDRYRHVIEDLARGSQLGETEIAFEAIELARRSAEKNGTHHRRSHVGYYLIGSGLASLELLVGYQPGISTRLGRWRRELRLPLYVGPILILSMLLAVSVLAALGYWSGELYGGGSGGGLDWWVWLFSLPLLIAASALATPLVNLLAALTLPPRALPRMNFAKGIPEHHRTMVVVPTLLTCEDEADDLLEALEIRYLGNRDTNLFFALLTDFVDAAEETLPGDDALLDYVRTGIKALNDAYKDDRHCIFYLFHRPRRWNLYERVWMGYERKRGKLAQFNDRLRGEADTAFSTIIGDCSILESIRYVITLDTDTQLPRDAAYALVGNLAHPLNRPVFDASKGRIVEGYGILQPRVSISLVSAGQSRFARLFAGDSGLDPYTREVSDVYQDVFGEGSFVGKGIYDVDAFREATEGRFPENLILSHDLLEGGYARSGLVTDVELIEAHPASYTQESSRRHRWMRGDWQLAGWLLPWILEPATTGGAKLRWRANPLTALSRWKLFDNLRRSLVAPSLLALLSVGWLAGVGPGWLWTLLVLAVLVLPAAVSSAVELVRKPPERDWLVHLSLTGKSTGRPVALALLTLVFLPYDAMISLGAMLRSGGRMLFTRRGLLLWQLPSYARRNARRTPAEFCREMWVAPALALALAVMLIASGQVANGLFAMPILVLWTLSPLVAWWISQPLVAPAPGLGAGQYDFLRVSARQTWRYFADFVGPDDNWLPPDNVQTHPGEAIATRTSPTNIGMSLLADLAAVDFGYLTVGESLQRLERTLASMEKLERYHGHFYNWYDTRTLQPLRPCYISSVDSGNLVGSLVTLKAGLAEMKDLPVLPAAMFEGLQDTLSLLMTHLPDSTTSPVAQRLESLQLCLQRLITEGDQTLQGGRAGLNEVVEVSGDLADMVSGVPGAGDETTYWARAFDRQLRAIREELLALAPDSWQGGGQPSRTDLVGFGGDARRQVDHINQLIQRCEDLAEMDFSFLYDSVSGLLTIGYDVGERRRDPACYDLLASEARLASFLLIAQGQVPQKHWFTLGRLLTSHGGDISLISWSGSMFEYLMPLLIMPGYPDTLLDHSCKAAVKRQIEYGRQRAVPWGISESCYNATDLHQVYQYRAFGVPGLGFKRGLGDDLVIAPYATALALTVMPRESCHNLQVLAEQGVVGPYGFYEAIDYTPSRVPHGKSYAIVRTFMAHHQGMSLLAFAHVLLAQPMQRRFMSDPQARATELLLQERVPKKGATLHPHAAEVSAAATPPSADADSTMRVFSEPDMQLPEVHLLSNGRYHVMATHAGGGISRWGDLAITRWREDATTDSWGTFVYLRDRDTGEYWSAAYQPTRRPADDYQAIFVQARAEYRRCDQGIEAHTEISVSPEDDVEIRRLTLTNQSARTRHIEVTSYAEVVLAPLNADLAHRSFSNLFVQTEILPGQQAILCTRRRRTPGEQVPWMFHLLATPGVVADGASFETDRARFIGRGRTAANPVAMDHRQETSSDNNALSNTQGPVLDPIVAIRNTLTILPDESATVQVISGIAATREAALALLEKYCDRHFVERAFEMSWFQSQEVLRHLNVTEADAQVFGRLANSVIFGNALRRAEPSVIARNRLRQSSLWPFAISGDLPIVLLHIGDVHRIDLVKQVLNAHAYWRMKGLAADLVIINEDFSGYRAELQDQIVGLINGGHHAQLVDKPGGVFLRRAEEISQEDRILLQTVARIVFKDTVETRIEQVERRVSAERRSDRLDPPEQVSESPVVPLVAPERIFFNGLGGFTPDGKEYVISLEPGQVTPAPWANVIASPHIGTVVSESGSAYTWAENAHEFRLTTWHNDPLSDISGEAIYLRDEQTGEFWSPTPLPATGKAGYLCRHGFGYSVFEHQESGIASEMVTYVAMDAAVKFLVVKLENQSSRPRHLSLTGYWELVMGEWRHGNLMHIVTEIDSLSGALFARNAYGRECANRIVFAQVSDLERSVSGSRAEFIGRNGSLTNPAVMRGKRLSGRTGAGLDPCAALQTRVELAVGEKNEVVFVFGAAANAAEARQLIQRFAGRAGAQRALDEVGEYWTRTLGAVQVDTPDPALNVLANGWLVYQTLSCRLWGRSGYYQSGGAFGFRDQLQDTLALMHTEPAITREQLLLHAGRQFMKGDVQHWWHPPKGQGVRTHFSDDYLWLPYATCLYVRATGDLDVLDEQTHFLEGRELYVDEESYYDQPSRSTETASLYEHCVRAIRYGLRFGVHHLPLIGCGDWNDGMNLVGKEGKGESVWLGWFLLENLELFAELASQRDDTEFSVLCKEQAASLRRNIESQAWDGEWYQRAWFDDGTPLGSSRNDECQIDSISQSWGVISGGADPERASRAMTAVDQRLVRRDKQIIQLLDPPFDRSGLEPGYIKGYIPGVRENGGQYTHAAIWATMAFAMMGNRTRAWELFAMLNPVNHGNTPEAVARYKVEPYVMSADIYGVAPHIGRGGWTWYTGASGWMYRLTVETLLGLKREGDYLRIKPCVPAEWGGYNIRYRFGETAYDIRIGKTGGCPDADLHISLDDIECRDGRIPLVNDGGEHVVHVSARGGSA